MIYFYKFILVMIGGTLLKLEMSNRRESGIEDPFLDLLGIIFICSTWFF